MKIREGYKGKIAPTGKSFETIVRVSVPQDTVYAKGEARPGKKHRRRLDKPFFRARCGFAGRGVPLDERKRPNF